MIKHNGSILVLVLILLVTLTAMAVGLVYRTRVELDLAYHSAKDVQAYYLALAGIERGLALLAASALDANSCTRASCFSQNALDEGLFQEVADGHGCSFDLGYSLRDEKSYLPVNGQFAARLEPLVGRGIAAQIVDWTDADDTPVDYSSAESLQYQTQTPPYRSKNLPLCVMRELLFLKDCPFDRYLGQAGDLGTRQGGYASHGPAPELGGTSLEPGLIDLVTVYGGDRININTVQPAVLSVVSGLDRSVAEAIAVMRAGPDQTCGTEDDRVLSQAQEISFDAIEGLTDVQRSLLRDAAVFCFESKQFRAFSIARVDPNQACGLMALIDCAGGAPEIVCLERLF